MSDLIDTDGENQAVRCFLLLYSGSTSLTVGQMKYHLEMSGFHGPEYFPNWVMGGHPDTHLTKGGAQDWLRVLFKIERYEHIGWVADLDRVPYFTVTEADATVVHSELVPAYRVRE